MNQNEEKVREQLRADSSDEVCTGQVWIYQGNGIASDGMATYPTQIRIICCYPFAEPADGRLWVVERYPGPIGVIYRIPELSLRLLYDLVEEAPES